MYKFNNNLMQYLIPPKAISWWEILVLGQGKGGDVPNQSFDFPERVERQFIFAYFTSTWDQS